MRIPLSNVFPMPRYLQWLLIIATLTTVLFLSWSFMSPLLQEGDEGITQLVRPLLWFLCGLFVGALLLAMETDNRMSGRKVATLDNGRETAAVLTVYIAVLLIALTGWTVSPGQALSQWCERNLAGISFSTIRGDQ